MELRSTDSGQEKRESYSFTTHISQMYNLLSSYHVGTNRAVFFVQPRPHILEEQSGFVRGPRAVEGIQEFFLIVAQPKNQSDYCVSLRLDTAHITTTPIMDYERRSELTDTALAIANTPTSSDRLVVRNIVMCVDKAPGPWPDDDIEYHKYEKTVTDELAYTAPNGFVIDSWSYATHDKKGNTPSPTINHRANTITASVRAISSAWRQVDEEADDECPKVLHARPAEHRLRLRVNLRSTTRTQKIADEEVLLITTRGLCCCPTKGSFGPGNWVTGLRPIPVDFGGTVWYAEPTIVSTGDLGSNIQQGAAILPPVNLNNSYSFDSVNLSNEEANEDDCNCQQKVNYVNSYQDKRMSIKQANDMIGFIKDEMLKSMSDPLPENAPKRFIETDFFARKFQAYQRANRIGRKNLNRRIGTNLSKPISEGLKNSSLSI